MSNFFPSIISHRRGKQEGIVVCLLDQVWNNSMRWNWPLNALQAFRISNYNTNVQNQHLFMDFTVYGLAVESFAGGRGNSSTHTNTHTQYIVIMKMKMQFMRNCVLLNYYYYYYRYCYMRHLHVAKRRRKTKTFHLVETEKCCA